jgi:hypothetical protein
VAICYTYRAHWELCNLPTQRDRDRYAPAIAAARDGLALFAEVGAGVSLRALQPEGASSSSSAQTDHGRVRDHIAVLINTAI